MNKEVEKLCESLEDLASSVENGWSDNRNLVDAFGWHHPAIDRYDLAYLAQSLAERIRNTDLETDDEDFLELVESIPSKLKSLKSKTLPQMFGGNGHQAIPAYIATLDWVESLIEPKLSWVVFNNPNAMPASVSRRIKGLNAKVNEIDVDQEQLTKQIDLINDATETAQSLPADLEDLNLARKNVESAREEILRTSTKIQTIKEDVDKLLEAIRENKQETDQLVANCEEAYRITTSKGLAGAFDQRASQLSRSMWVWVFGLLVSLAAAWYVGAERIEVLTGTLADPDPKWGMVFMHFLLAVVSLGAPLWFAWLSTKQVGQRFKLSEDYGFKASVAKAYEGYRREAARIDSELEARLFESALSRVEEAPLRFVDHGNHGTPWHELAESSGFKEAMQNFPAFREKVLSVAKTAVSNTKRKKNIDEVLDAAQDISE